MERYISKIKISNFLRIDEEIEVPLDRLTVLVGENGSGKSSILKAVHWAIRCATLADSSGKVTLEQMDYVPSKDFLDVGHKFKIQNSSIGRKSIVKFIDSEFDCTEIQISAARNEAGVKVFISGPLKSALIDGEKPSTDYIPGLAGLAEEETILATPVMHRKAASGEGGSALRQVLLQISGGPRRNSDYVELTELSTWVSKVLPGVHFWVKFDQLRDKFIDVKFLVPEMRAAGQADQVAWKAIDMAGTGFLQVVQIFAYLLYFKPKIMLVDEPDAHLHPTRQQSLIRTLSEATTMFPGTQFIVSTHSPALVRALPNSAKINWISEGGVRAQGNIVREKMGWSALDKDVIIFSEDGNTKYLESIINCFPAIQNRCLIWPTFGKDTLPSGEKAASISKKMGVKVIIHRDRDFMSDVDVEDWAKYKHYDTNNIPYWIPNSSDIEGLFTEPAYIAAALDVGIEVANEIIDFAMASFSLDKVRTDFSAAYSSAVTNLQKTPGRDPINRWDALGRFSKNTIKGKELMKEIKKACADILPQHGLATKISNQSRIGYFIRENLIGIELRNIIYAQVGLQVE